MIVYSSSMPKTSEHVHSGVARTGPDGLCFKKIRKRVCLAWLRCRFGFNGQLAVSVLHVLLMHGLAFAFWVQQRNRFCVKKKRLCVFCCFTCCNVTDLMRIIF